MNKLIQNSRLSNENKNKLQSIIDDKFIIKLGRYTIRIEEIGVDKHLGITELHMYEGRILFERSILNVDKISAEYISCYTYVLGKGLRQKLDINDILSQL